MPHAQALFSTPTVPNRVVVIGSGGFIGRHLCDLLEKKQIPVLGLSKQELDLTDPSSKESLQALLQPQDVVVVLCALTPRYGRGLDVFAKNILIAKHVCEAVQLSDVAHTIYLSSDAVYPFDDGITSEDSLAEPKDLYAAMHLSRELMFKTALQSPLLVLRPTLIYGAGDPHNSYGPNRMRRTAFATQKISLFGRGEEKRDHIFIQDVTTLILETILWRVQGVLNLATGHSISYKDLATCVASLFDCPISIETSHRNNPITYRHYDVILLHQLFPFFAFTSLEEGLKIAHLQEQPCTLPQ